MLGRASPNRSGYRARWGISLPRVERGGALDVVALALQIPVQIGDVAGDQHALGVVPGSGADAVARIEPRRGAPLLLADVGVPRKVEVQPAGGLGRVLTDRVAAGD